MFPPIKRAAQVTRKLTYGLNGFFLAKRILWDRLPVCVKHLLYRHDTAKYHAGRQ